MIPQKKQMQANVYEPTPKQELLLAAGWSEVMFGGGRGGGKTFGMGLKMLQHATMYGENARMLFLRRSYPELQQCIDDYKKLFRGIAEWKAGIKTFQFNNGAYCTFKYLDGDSASDLQGTQWTIIFCDEVGNYKSFDDVKILRACLRSAAGVPTQMILSCNPGGVMHNVLKAEYVDPAPPQTPIPFAWDKNGVPVKYKIFIPSTLSDNPHLLENDPYYIENLKQVGSPELVKMWVDGSWDVISGGAFDKLWDKNIHVMKRFRIPDNWKVVECYDEGQSAPWCCVWFAISDGSDYYLPNGESRPTIKGDVFAISEIYGWNGKPNEGTNESTRSKAAKILAKEEILGYKISRKVADSAMFSTKHNSVADEFLSYGVSFQRCDKSPGSRVIAANIFRNYLIGSIERKDNPGIFFFDNCINCIRTIPTLPRSKDNPDDVQTLHVEDHAYDCLCYNFLALDKETKVQTGKASFF